MSGRLAFRLAVVLAAVAGFTLLAGASAPIASAGIPLDSGGAFWPGAGDDLFSNLVPLTTTPYGWDGAAYGNLYTGQSGLVSSALSGAMEGTVESAAVAGGADVGLGLVGLVSAGTPAIVAIGGAYVAYKYGPNWFHWKSLFGGGNSGSSSSVCGVLTSASSSCEAVPISQGDNVCLTTTNGNTANWVAPANGLLLETTNSSYEMLNFQNSNCSGSAYQVVELTNISANSTKIGDANAQARVQGLSTGINGGGAGMNQSAGVILIWFESTGTNPAVSAFGSSPDNVQPYVGGAGQPTTHSAVTSPAYNPNHAALAAAYKRALTCNGDTYGGVTPSWGTNGYPDGSSGCQLARLQGEMTDCAMGATCRFTGSNTGQMPDCINLLAATCKNTLDARGFTGTVSETVLDEDHSDLTKGSGAVVTQDPAGGAVIQLGGTSTVTLTENPSPLPIILPAPHANETEDEYAARIGGLGYTGTITTHVLTTADGLVGTSGVVTVQRSSDRKAVYAPNWPASGLRVEPGEALDIWRNPDDAPPVDNGGAGGGDCSLTPLNVDLAAFDNVSATNKFPFGLFAWMYNGVGGLNGAANAPVFNVPLLGHTVTGHTSMTVDLSILNPFMVIFRQCVLILCTFGFIYWFATSFLGFVDWAPGEQGTLF